MGKIYDIYEEELSDIRGRLMSSLTAMLNAKGLSTERIKLTEVYAISSKETIIGISGNTALIDDGDIYDFNELETDIILWLLYQVEEKQYVIW